MSDYLSLFLIPPIVDIILAYSENLIVILHKYGINLFDGKEILPFLDYENYRPDNLWISKIKENIRLFSLGKWIELTDINSFLSQKEWIKYSFITESSSIYLIGGDAFADLKISYKFNLVDNSRIELPSMNSKRCWHSLTILENRLYAIGGHFYNDVPATDEYYDGNKWINIKRMNIPRSNHQSIVHKGKIYVFGGNFISQDILPVERYDPEENTWTNITYIPLNRHSFKVISFENLIYIIGGSIMLWNRYSNNEKCEKIDIYNPDINEWSTCETGAFYEDVHLSIL